MKIYFYYHNVQRTIYDVLIVLSNENMKLFFHGTDREIAYNDIRLSESQYGTSIIYGSGCSIPWMDTNKVINNRWEEKEIDFIALDVEIATKEQMICQLGLSLVVNRQIVGSCSWYIQPPSNIYEWQTVKIHHINAETTKDSPTFLQAWDEISEYLSGTKIVAHNAANFDEIVLRKNLEYYHIDDSKVEKFIDTIDLWGVRIALEDLCAGFGWSDEGHHDAQWDANTCAKIYLQYLSGNQPNWELVEQHRASRGVKSIKSSSDIEQIKKKKITGDVLKKDLSKAKPDNNPFYDKKIVVTGDFNLDRKSMAEILQNLGADVNTSISKLTNYVIIGNKPGPAKIQKIEQLRIDGYNIRTLSEADFNRIVNGIDREDLSEYML